MTYVQVRKRRCVAKWEFDGTDGIDGIDRIDAYMKIRFDRMSEGDCEAEIDLFNY